MIQYIDFLIKRAPGRWRVGALVVDSSPLYTLVPHARGTSKAGRQLGNLDDGPRLYVHPRHYEATLNGRYEGRLRADLAARVG